MQLFSAKLLNYILFHFIALFYVCDVYCQTVYVTHKQLESGCLTPLGKCSKSAAESEVIWELLLVFEKMWHLNMRKLLFYFTCKTFYFFPASALSTVHAYHRVILPKWWCPGLQHIYLSLIQMAWFWLTGHCLFLLTYQNLGSVALVPPKESWKFCDRKRQQAKQ